MTTVADVLKVAESQVGYVETGGRDGHSGNITKFWQELAPSFQGQPWCAAFIRWTDKHAGAPLLPIQNPYYCPSVVTYAKQHGLWTQHGKAGDYVLCDFNGHGVAEHIGRLRVDYDGRATHQVDGNTSNDDLGSQANGGGVYNKIRGAGVILGFLAYSTLLARGIAPRNPVKHNPYPLPHGVFHRGETGTGVRFIQWAAGVPVDGQFGVQTEHAVRVFQQYHGLTVDGIAGPQTLAALAKITH
jgi:hypothetical protein